MASPKASMLQQLLMLHCTCFSSVHSALALGAPPSRASALGPPPQQAANGTRIRIPQICGHLHLLGPVRPPHEGALPLCNRPTRRSVGSQARPKY